MAKQSMINREIKRMGVVEKYAAKRSELKKIIHNAKSSYEERREAQFILQSLPRDACAFTEALSVNWASSWLLS